MISKEHVMLWALLSALHLSAGCKSKSRSPIIRSSGPSVPISDDQARTDDDRRPGDGSRPATIIEPDFGDQVDRIQYQDCFENTCNEPVEITAKEFDAQVIELPADVDTVRVRACDDDSQAAQDGAAAPPACNGWQVLEFDDSSSGVGTVTKVAIGTVAVVALGSGAAFVGYKAFHAKVERDLKKYIDNGDKFATKLQERVRADQIPKLPATSKSPRFLHAFDLDDTIMHKAFKHRGRATNPELFLKPGMRTAFANIIQSGGHIMIATNNVREVEYFLMRELGFDVNSTSDLRRLRTYISVEQPTIKHNPTWYGKILNTLMEPFKSSKGSMVARVLKRFGAEYFDGVVMSDDKRRFHRDVQQDLAAFFKKSGRKAIPVVTLEVGDRKGNAKAAFETVGSDPIHPSKSITFADLNNALAKSPSLRRLFLDTYRDIANDNPGATLVDEQVKKTVAFLKDVPAFKDAFLKADVEIEPNITSFKDFTATHNKRFQDAVQQRWREDFGGKSPRGNGMVADAWEQVNHPKARAFSPADSDAKMRTILKTGGIGAAAGAVAGGIIGAGAIFIFRSGDDDSTEP